MNHSVEQAREELSEIVRKATIDMPEQGAIYLLVKEACTNYADRYIDSLRAKGVDDETFLATVYAVMAAGYTAGVIYGAKLQARQTPCG